MSPLKPTLLALSLWALCACSTTPSTAPFPDPPPALMTPPPALRALPVDRVVTLSDIARVTVENAGIHDTVAAELAALQDWVRQQKALSGR